MIVNSISISLAGIVALGLCACNDETTIVSESHTMSILESGKKLGSCFKDNAGEMVYVTDSSKVYFCADGKWRTLNGKDGKDGENGSNSSGSSDNNGATSQVDKANLIYLNPAIDYGEITDDRDDQVYKTVKIGKQVWMAENLNFKYKIISKENDRKKMLFDFCADGECKNYGAYYTWAGAMDSTGLFSDNGKGCGYNVKCSPTYPVRGVCPKGWHLPEKAELEKLLENVKGDFFALQAQNFEEWFYATNSFGFSAIPLGYYSPFDDKLGLLGLSSTTYFWSASYYSYGEDDYSEGSAFCLEIAGGGANVDDRTKKYGMSVRCIMD